MQTAKFLFLSNYIYLSIYLGLCSEAVFNWRRQQRPRGGQEEGHERPGGPSHYGGKLNVFWVTIKRGRLERRKVFIKVITIHKKEKKCIKISKISSKTKSFRRSEMNKTARSEGT